MASPAGDMQKTAEEKLVDPKTQEQHKSIISGIKKRVSSFSKSLGMNKPVVQKSDSMKHSREKEPSNPQGKPVPKVVDSSLKIEKGPVTLKKEKIEQRHGKPTLVKETVTEVKIDNEEQQPLKDEEKPEKKVNMFGRLFAMDSNLKKLLNDEKKASDELRHRLDQSMDIAAGLRQQMEKGDNDKREINKLLRAQLDDATEKRKQDEAMHEEAKNKLEDMLQDLREEVAMGQVRFESSAKSYESTISGLRTELSEKDKQIGELKQSLTLADLRLGKLRPNFKISATLKQIDASGGIVSDPIEFGGVSLTLKAFKCKDNHLEMRVIKTGEPEMIASIKFTFDSSVVHDSKNKKFDRGSDWKGAYWNWGDFANSRDGLLKEGLPAELLADVTVHELINPDGSVMLIVP